MVRSLKPKGYLSVHDLEQFVRTSAARHKILLEELFDKLNRQIECGMHEGDIIHIDNMSPKTTQMVLLKESALERYVAATGLEHMSRPRWMERKYIGVGEAAVIFSSNPNKMKKVFADLYENIKNGKISENVLPKDTIQRIFTNKTKYIDSLKTDTQIIEMVAELYKLKLHERYLKAFSQNKAQNKELNKAKTNRASAFEFATQTFRDAWGDEWTTTYSRTPRGKDER